MSKKMQKVSFLFVIRDFINFCLKPAKNTHKIEESFFYLLDNILIVTIIRKYQLQLMSVLVESLLLAGFFILIMIREIRKLYDD